MPENHPLDPPQAAPFLKWAGGKSQLLEQYAPLFPERAETYYEPFVGSGAVFFYLRGRGFARRYCLYDINEELINVYRVVQGSLDDLIELLAEHQARHSRAYYYEVRNRDRDPTWQKASAVERAARMIYLNKTCYNGLWRVNSRGHFNVPMGRYRNPTILDEARLRAASAALQNVEVAVRDFREPPMAGPADFVYFDPPYHPLSETASFTGYSADDFDEDDQRDLARVYRELAARGCRVMLSNSDTPLVHALYADFTIETVQARRAINTRADRRGAISEVVVLNYHNHQRWRRRTCRRYSGNN